MSIAPCSAFFHDFLHGVLHFDGKLWRTLPLLAWKPGALTRRYIDGQRASFISPMALFLFSVFLMFAVLNSVGSAPFSFGGDGGFKVETSMKEELPKLRGRARRPAACPRRGRRGSSANGQDRRPDLRKSEEGIRVITDMQTKDIGQAMADAARRATEAQPKSSVKTAAGP